MKIQILVSTMNQTGYGLVSKMNLFADAIIINQCNRTGYTSFKYNGNQIDWYDCEERGIGKSRNAALMAAKADICVFADDDLVYGNGAYQAVEETFSDLSDAAVLFFNMEGQSDAANCKAKKRLHSWNAYRYGAASMAVKRREIIKNRISFSLLFGGGAKYSCGEDTLFIADCLKKGLNIYAVPALLGSNLGKESTWFRGYNKKYFFDKGVLYAAMSPILSKLFCIRYALLHSDLFISEVSRKQALKWMLEGAKEGQK